MGPPWFNRLVTPLALVLVLLTAIGPMLAWRRFTPSSLRRILTVPLAVVALALVVLLALTDAADSPPSLAMFCLVAFVLAAVGQELVARHDGAPHDDAASPGRARWRGSPAATAAATAASWCTPASRCCSWAWRRRRRSSTSATCACRPATRSSVNGYDVTYREATAKLGGDSAGTGAPISFGAVLDVRKDGKHFVLRPSRNYYASARPLARDDLALLRGRGHQRGRRPLGPHARLLAGGAARHRLARAADPRGRRQVRRLARRRSGADRGRARRALPQRPAAGGVPCHRLAAGGVDLDRRRDRRCSARWWRPGRRPRRGCGGCARSTRPAWAKSSRARRRRWSTRSPWSCSPRSWLWCCRCRCAGAGWRSAARRRGSPS